MPVDFQNLIALFTRSISDLPTISSIVRKPSCAMISLSSSAMKRMKLTTYSGLPSNFARSFGFCVATPKGHVSRLHTRIMAHPRATRGPVAKPNSSAPSRHAIATSRPVRSLPSASTVIRERRSLRSSVWCASATPSSQGRPAWRIDVLGAAPVPPS